MKKLVKFQKIKDELYFRRETYEDLGKIIDKSASTVSKKIIGEVRWNEDEIRKVCIHFNKSFEELFC
jgi:hypothetical protein